MDALEQFESHERDFHPAALRRQALRFSQQRFADEIFRFVDDVLQPRQVPSRQAA